MKPETRISYKDRWCPFARTEAYGHGLEDKNFALAGINRRREDANPSWARCIGPRCMMFRGDEFAYEHDPNRGDPALHAEWCGMTTML